MKKLNTEFAEHIRNETTTLCRCWIIETVVGTLLGFTDHDEDILLNGVLCERRAGMETSVVEEQLGLNSNSAEVAGALISEQVSEERISSGFFDKARVSTYLVNWSAPSQYCLDQVMFVGDITREDGAYRMELRGLLSELDQTKGRHFVKRCQADLGDHQCRVNLSTASFSSSGTVVEASSKTSFAVDGLAQFEAGWFGAGELVWNTGDNQGQAIQVLDHSAGSGVANLTLWRPTAKAVEVGDTFTITAGCAKDFGTCKRKFSNHKNFQGFPHMPGNSFAVNYASNSGTNNGTPIIP